MKRLLFLLLVLPILASAQNQNFGAVGVKKSLTLYFSTDSTPVAGAFKLWARDSSTFYLITPLGKKINVKLAGTGGGGTALTVKKSDGSLQITDVGTISVDKGSGLDLTDSGLVAGIRISPTGTIHTGGVVSTGDFSTVGNFIGNQLTLSGQGTNSIAGDLDVQGNTSVAGLTASAINTTTGTVTNNWNVNGGLIASGVTGAQFLADNGDISNSDALYLEGSFNSLLYGDASNFIRPLSFVPPQNILFSQGISTPPVWGGIQADAPLALSWGDLNNSIGLSVLAQGITQDLIKSGNVVKSLNGLHDTVFVVGEGGASTRTSNDTLYINAGSGAGAGDTIRTIQSTNGTISVTSPNGPTVTVNVANSGITATQLASNAVTTAKINALAVDSTKIAAATINSSKFTSTAKIPYADTALYSRATDSSIMATRYMLGIQGEATMGTGDSVQITTAHADTSWGGNATWIDGTGGVGVIQIRFYTNNKVVFETPNDFQVVSNPRFYFTLYKKQWPSGGTYQ